MSKPIPKPSALEWFAFFFAGVMVALMFWGFYNMVNGTKVTSGIIVATECGDYEHSFVLDTGGDLLCVEVTEYTHGIMSVGDWYDSRGVKR